MPLSPHASSFTVSLATAVWRTNAVWKRILSLPAPPLPAWCLRAPAHIMSARVTLADFRALQENLLALKHENYAMRELLRRQQAQAAAPEGAASPAWYPPDLNPFGPGLPRPSTPPATGDGGSAAGSEPEQGSTGGGDTPLPATPERVVRLPHSRERVPGGRSRDGLRLHLQLHVS